jgi:hypothetical protein
MVIEGNKAMYLETFCFAATTLVLSYMWGVI